MSAPFVGALDAFTAGLTYVVDIKRRLLSSYTGPAATVRAARTGQPTYQIPYLANGAWDTAGLLSFAGSDSVYVTDLPMQYGSMPSLAQAVALSQPRIVNAGVLETDGMFFQNSGSVRLEMAFSDITDLLSAAQGQIICLQRAPATAASRPFATTAGGLFNLTPYVGYSFFDYGNGTSARIYGTFPAAADDVPVLMSFEHVSGFGSINIGGVDVVSAMAQTDSLASGAGSFEFGQASDCWLSSLAIWNTCDGTLAAARRAALV